MQGPSSFSTFTQIFITTGSPGQGLFLYFGSIGKGNLVGSAVSQPGNDPAGNPVQQTFTAYTLGDASNYVSLNAGGVLFGTNNPSTVISSKGQIGMTDPTANNVGPYMLYWSPSASGSGAGAMRMYMIGQSRDGTIHPQMVITNTNTGTPSPTTTALVEVQGSEAITSGGLSVIGGIVTDTLEVTGVTDLDGTLDVASTSVFNAAVSITAGGLTISAGGENITGGSIIDTLEVTGVTDLDGSLDVAGATVLNGTLTTQAAHLNNDPTSPAATASTTQVMMGLGSSWTLTPHSSGNVFIMVTGTATTNTAIATVKWGGRFGTGTAPVNGAADTGTHWGPGNDPSTRPSVAAVGVPFALNAIVALTPGTTYWFDLAVSTGVAADTAAVQNLAFTVFELT